MQGEFKSSSLKKKLKNRCSQTKFCTIMPKLTSSLPKLVNKKKRGIVKRTPFLKIQGKFIEISYL